MSSSAAFSRAAKKRRENCRPSATKQNKRNPKKFKFLLFVRLVPARENDPTNDTACY